MKKVKVDRFALLDIVKKNRAKHEKTYQDGVSVYRKELAEKLEEMLADAKAGKDVAHAVNLCKPSDHLEAYDQIISMLELSLDEEIELDAVEFSRYVMDKWEWMSEFHRSTGSYAAKMGM